MLPTRHRTYPSKSIKVRMNEDRHFCSFPPCCGMITRPLFYPSLNNLSLVSKGRWPNTDSEIRVRYVLGTQPHYKFYTRCDNASSVLCDLSIYAYRNRTASRVLSFQPAGINARQYGYVHGNCRSFTSDISMQFDHLCKDYSVYPLPRSLDRGLPRH